MDSLSCHPERSGAESNGVPSRELPLSTFDPILGARSRPEIDYREAIKECGCLLTKVQKLKADYAAAHPGVITAIPSPS